MKTVERTGAPALGNAIGLFLALWAINHFDWLPTEEKEYIVAAAGTVCIHILMEFRNVLGWLAGRLGKPQS